MIRIDAMLGLVDLAQGRMESGTEKVEDAISRFWKTQLPMQMPWYVPWLKDAISEVD